MIVICKRPTKRLVKGLRYEVASMYNSTTHYVSYGTVLIKGIGSFSVKNFTDVDGNPLPKINITGVAHNYKLLEFSELKTGDIIVCMTDRYKLLSKNCIYRIESLQEAEKSGINFKFKTSFIKLEGIPRKIIFNGWRFRKLNTDESRDMTIGKIFNEDDKVIKTKIRKIDLSPNKKTELIKALSKSILDPYRHQLSIIEWTCQKSSENLGIIPDDFKELLELPLKDILTEIEPSK